MCLHNMTVLALSMFLFVVTTQGQGKRYDDRSLADIFQRSWTQKKIDMRNKRGFDPVASAEAIQEAILLGVNFTYGVIHGQMQLAKLRAISSRLDQLDQKLDSLGRDVKSLQVGQQWIEGAVLYGKDVQRLMFFIDYLSQSLSLQNDGGLAPAAQADRWADAVLEFGADGVKQVLYNIHNMVTGDSALFSQKPLLVIFEAKLVKDSDAYWGDIQKFVEFIYSVQISGYAAWDVALNVKGRNSELTTVQQLSQERRNIQKPVIDGLTIEWPAGYYGLPKTTSGCPLAAGVQWSHGWRYHDTEDDDGSNDWSSGIHFPGGYGRNNMKQYFCMKTGSGGAGSWPHGNYCIFKKYRCPSGFSQGSVKWDDEDHNNKNNVNDSLPDGSYDRNTVIEYCCRQDGSSSTPISLPIRQPFYLFRFSGSCQKVLGATVREEYFRWDDEDDDNANAKHGSYPYDDGGRRNHKIHYCYYS